MSVGTPFTDDRGTITDLLGGIDSVTEIVTVAGAIRGNHVHHHTTQVTYVVTGMLRVVTPDRARVIAPGEMWIDKPGVPHAWKALTDTVCLVFTKGPRSGADYESDTERLEEPLIK